MAHKATIKEKVFSLRKSGYSYSYISEKTGVTKSTLSGWLSNVSYKPNKEMIEKIGKARATSNLVKSKQKLESMNKAVVEAKKDIDIITKRDLFMLGIGVYIGEGSKSHGIVRVVNSNPGIIKFMIRWFEEICGLSKDNFKIRLHIYPDNDEKDCIGFWSKMTGVSVNNFQKTQVDIRKNKKFFKKGKLPYGTAHLSVNSNGKKEFGVFLARKINAWMEEVLK